MAMNNVHWAYYCYIQYKANFNICAANSSKRVVDGKPHANLSCMHFLLVSHLNCLLTVHCSSLVAFISQIMLCNWQTTTLESNCTRYCLVVQMYTLQQFRKLPFFISSRPALIRKIYFMILALPRQRYI